MVVLWTNSSEKKPFLLRNYWNRDILDTNKYYSRVDCWKAKQELPKN
jgi:hypothetical protein